MGTGWVTGWWPAQALRRGRPQSVRSRFQTAADAASTPDLDQLRRLGVWAPVAFMCLLAVCLEVFLRAVSWAGSAGQAAAYALAIGAVAAGAYFFSAFMFRVIRQKEDEASHRTDLLTTVNAVGAVANESLDLDEILNRTLERVLDLTGADAAEILLWDADAELLTLRAFQGRAADAFHERRHFRLGEGFPGRIARTGQPIVIEHLSDDEHFLRPRVVAAGFRSVAGVPLRSKRTLVGVMDIATLREGHLGAADTDLLSLLGNQIGVAIENARLYAQTRDFTVLEERQRIAREMHDGLAQQLGFLGLKLSHLEACAPTDECREELRQLRSVAIGACEEVRQAVFGLKTMVSRGLGLVPTLTEYLHDFSAQADLPVTLEVRHEGATRLDFRAEVQLIRIVQEALANVRKHARATRARVVFDLEGLRPVIQIEDDGCGFDTGGGTGARGETFGLTIMRERAESLGGTLEVQSEPGTGTRVIARLPIAPAPATWQAR